MRSTRAWNGHKNKRVLMSQTDLRRLGLARAARQGWLLNGVSLPAAEHFTS